MKNIALKFLTIASVVAISACSNGKDEGFPSLSANKSQQKILSEGSNKVTSKSYVELANVKNTGTFVGQKTATFRNELAQIQNANRSHADELQKIRNQVLETTAAYNNNVSALETKLQVGTTPGNPDMYAMLSKAGENLQTISTQSAQLDNLSAKVTNNATAANYLVDNIRSAFGISGAVDEDHSQLRVLQNEAEQVSVLIDSLGAEASSDVNNQQQYIINAKTQLNSLSRAIKVGNFQGKAETLPLFTGKATPANEKPAGAKPTAAVRGKPIFSAKFNNDNVDYKAGLKASVEAALERKPNSMFDVVAVSTSASHAKAQTNANKIFQDIVALGANPNNINLSAKEGVGSVPMVQVYAK